MARGQRRANSPVIFREYGPRWRLERALSVSTRYLIKHLEPDILFENPASVTPTENSGVSRLPALIDYALPRPVVSAGMLAEELKVTSRAAQDLVAELGLREATGRGGTGHWGFFEDARPVYDTVAVNTNPARPDDQAAKCAATAGRA
jgi:HTH DNA binding domain